MKRNYVNTKGFTLVELIIVITILAILGTIAFMSYQGYTAQAKNTKRKQDLSTLQNGIEVKKASVALKYTDFVNYSSSRSLSSIDLAGSGSISSTGNYKAGTINADLLSTTATIRDIDSDSDYSYGATNFKGGQLQLAAKIEKENGSYEAYVIGNYKKRTDGSYSGTVSGTNFTLTDISNIGKFYVGDYVTIGTGGVISSISNDGKTLGITVDSGGTLSGTNIKLTKAESDGLIWGNSESSSGVVENGGTILPY